MKDGYFTEKNCPFIIKPNFSTSASIIEIKLNFVGTQISFVHDDSTRDLLGFGSVLIYEKYKLSQNPVDKLSFDKIFLECDIAQGMNFRGKRRGIIHSFTTDIDPGYKYIEKFRGGVQWFMMESKDTVSTICFKLKNENNKLVSFNGQSITFRLPIKEI